MPGADPKLLTALRDKAIAARAEIEIAHWRYEWPNHVAQWWDPRVPREEMKPLLDALQSAQDQRVKLQRERIEQDRQIREADAQVAQAEHELWLAHNAAVAARDHPGR